MTALLPLPASALPSAGVHDPSALAEIPREGPYRVLFDRLVRLVRYRADLLVSIDGDPSNAHAVSELVRIRHMLKEVHRGVSINLAARQLAERIDAGETAARSNQYAY
jgi:hypothetical protein